MRQRERRPTPVDPVSKTHQSFGPESDINNIIRRHGIKPPDPGSLNYFDNIGFTSFHDAVELVRQADEQFAALPARTREIFHNDPANLIAAVEAASAGDETARDHLVRAKFLKPRPAEPEPTAPVAPTAGTTPANPSAPQNPPVDPSTGP